MAIGPVQLLVIGFDSPEFRGEALDELARLRESNAVRVIDALALYKDPEGEMNVMRISNLTEDESIEFGAKVGALIGLGAAGAEGFVAGAELGAWPAKTASRSSPTTRRRTSSRISRTTRPWPSCSSSITGRSPCGMPYGVPAASIWRVASSGRATSSPSASSAPWRPRSWPRSRWATKKTKTRVQSPTGLRGRRGAS